MKDVKYGLYIIRNDLSDLNKYYILCHAQSHQQRSSDNPFNCGNIICQQYTEQLHHVTIVMNKQYQVEADILIRCLSFFISLE